MQKIIFIHGLESSGQGFKGKYLKSIFTDILTPDFKKFDYNIPIYHLFEERMNELNKFLAPTKHWVIIGSSFGGLMGAFYTLRNSEKVNKLILLAPFLTFRNLNFSSCKAVDVPAIAFHGINDNVVPYKSSHEIAKLLFTNLEYNIVDDDHSLHHTVKVINWLELVLNI
ncbi:MAG: alpha/beta fold hydrolase [Promethearchaeota archaeon]